MPCDQQILKERQRINESQRINAFELWCWRTLLRVPWTARSNQSILKEISPEYSLEGLMLNLKLQYFGHLKRRADSFEKILMLGKIECRRRRGRQMAGWHHRLNGHEFEQALGDGEGQGSLVCPWGCKEPDRTERLNNTNKQKNVHRGASEDLNKSVHSSTIHDSPNEELLKCPSTVDRINKLWLIHAME